MTLTAQNTVAWHDKNTAQHKALVDKWAKLGFRTLSLAIYGDTGDLSYAAVMVKRATVHPESQVFPRSQAALQTDFDNYAKIGRGPYIISATGPAGAPVFAASFRPVSTIPFTRLNLSLADFEARNAARHALGEILVWVDVFGDASNPRFTAIWGPNPDRVAWSIDGYDPAAGKQEIILNAALVQQRYDAIASTWARPAHVAVTPTGAVAELFVDSTVGTWHSRTGMTAAGYQAEYDTQSKAGLQPVQVSAKGTGSKARFAAIFASREETDPRTFRSKGPVTVAGIDSVMQDFMQARNLRGAALAIAVGTRLVYAKGYTLAEAGYPDVTPQTPFRQASVSKMFTAAAMMRAMQLNRGITLDTTVQSIMNLKQPDGSPPADSRWAEISIRHLLESDSGIQQGLLYGSPDASKAFKTPLPATPAQLLSYATSLMLTGAPGDKNNSVYGNFDYLLLGQLLAKIRGTATYEEALQQLVLQPLHQTHTRGSRSLIADQQPGEARYHMTVYDPNPAGWKLYPFEVLPTERTPDGKLVPTHYGQLDFEMFGGGGGLSASIVDMARLGAMFSDREKNPVLSPSTIDAMLTACATASMTLKGPDGKASHGFYGFDSAAIWDAAKHVYFAKKGGWLPAQGTWLQFATGGFTYAWAINVNQDPDYDWFDPISAVAQSHDWGTTDLFSTSFGMPSLTPPALPPPFPIQQPPITDTLVQVRASMSSARRERPRVEEAARREPMPV
jgi:CubicO group peptidase (beta-lactamase class C family)